MKNLCFEQLQKMQQMHPLVHNITNYVVMNSSANNLLAIGASPIMAHALEEVEEMVSLAQSLVINIGTLSTPWIQSMERAIQKANDLNRPVILDPVGVMCSELRRKTVKNFLSRFQFSAIRGNASEIMGIYSLLKTVDGEDVESLGVDSLHQSKEAIFAAEELSKITSSIVCISGEVDYVVSQDKKMGIANGHPLMKKVTGMGCTSTAVIGAFLALKENSFLEVLAGQLCVSLAGERAYSDDLENRPGSFEIKFRDELGLLNKKDFSDAVFKQF